MISRVDRSKCQHPHPGLIIASHTFKEPYFAFSDFDQLSLAIMDLLLRGAYPYLSGSNYAKFNVLFTMFTSGGTPTTFAAGRAIALTYEDGKWIQKSEIYALLF